MPRRKKEDELPPDQKGPPRGAANARERTRMRVLSKAFGRLKLTLPWVPPDTKLSKLDTLRLATSYISHLQVLLESEDDDNEGSDNDNDRDIKIDSSVRTRQLTSLVSMLMFSFGTFINYAESSYLIKNFNLCFTQYSLL